MARRPNLEVIKEKIAPEYHYLLDDVDKADEITQFWRLDDKIIAKIIKSIPEDIRPIFKARLEAKPEPQGAKSLLPYSKEAIQKAAKYMSYTTGTTVKDIEGTEYTISSVQVQFKVKSGDKNLTLALSRMAD